MNNFTNEKQNESSNLTRLSAQRYLYSSAKFWLGIQYAAVILITFFGILGTIKFGFKVALGSLVFLIFDTFLIEKFIRGRLKEAALIQEDFDCDVLNLEWSKTKCSSRVPLEEVKLYANKMEGDVTSQNLIDWYPKSAFSLPVHAGRVICQRANVVWNVSGRKKILLSVQILTILCAIVLVGSLFIPGMETEKWFYIILIPSLPLLNRLKDIWQRLSASLERLLHLQNRIHDLWNDVKSKRVSEEKLTTLSREFQNELFTFRSQELPVFDFLYWRLRSQNEKAMNETAEKIAQEWVSAEIKDIRAN